MATARRAASSRLGADAWVDAALGAIGEGGVVTVAVEPLAAALGVTKGSFYWHFPNRDALLAAAMHRWEERATRDVIAAADRGGTPRQRLALLLELVVRPAPEHAIERAILAAGADPIVSPSVDRITERRLAYLVSIFRDLGLGPAVARRRAYTAYAAYLGMLQLDARGRREQSVRSSAAYVAELVELFAGHDA